MTEAISIHFETASFYKKFHQNSIINDLRGETTRFFVKSILFPLDTSLPSLESLVKTV